MRSTKPRAFFVLLCLVSAGCATVPKTHPKTHEMEQAFQKADGFYFAKNLPAAEAAYRAYTSSFPMNELTPKAWFRLGEISFHNKDYPAAATFYKKSFERLLDPEWGVFAIYKRGVCFYKIGDLKKVIPAVDLMPTDLSNAKVALRAAGLHLTVAKRLEEPLEQIRGHLKLIDAWTALSSSETEVGDLNWITSEKTAREEIRKWIESGPLKGEDVGRLKNWLKRHEGKPSEGALFWRLARLSHQKGDYEEAARWAHRTLVGYPKQEYAAAASSLLEELRKRGISPVAEKGGEEGGGGRSVVGVLLPLSGKFAVYGESVLHGLECAAGIFAPCRGNGVNLVIRDTRGDPEVAARLVGELSSNPQVKVIVGPLPQVEVDEAAKAAEERQLPMITLSQKTGAAKAGDFVFRNFLTVADQVATVVAFACDEKKWKKLGILFPEGEAGREYQKVFQEEVERCGGKVVAEASYSPESEDFADAIRGLKFSSARQTLGQAAPFEALFIPDVYRRIPKIAQVLKREGMEIPLLGGAGWNHPGIVKEGAADLEGSIFVDGFFAKGSNYPVRDFVSTFHAAFGVEPTLLEAYAYDTMRLVGNILKDHPTISRPELQQTLSHVKNFSGVTGNISFDEDGDARRRLFLLTIRGGEIVEVR